MLNARDTAVQALLKVEYDSAYSNIVLNNILKTSHLHETDRAFATALFYGVLDHRITLDYVLERLTKTPFIKVDSLTANVLRVALLQIMFMDRIPDSAAVNEAVKQIKRTKQRNKSGFVNAVLRSAIRAENLFPDSDDPQSLSIKYSCPKWIVDEFVKDYGVQTTVKILEESLKPAPIHLKINTIRITADEFCKKAAEVGINCKPEENGSSVAVMGNIEIDKNPLYSGGLFHVQDLSSQRAVKLLGPIPGERILDLCAAPGGKSFTIAEMMQNNGCVVSCDIYKNRVGLIESQAKRLGLSAVNPIVADATVFDKNLGRFDAVLCDVPCSGLGVIRRKPDIKYKTVNTFTKLENIQQRILNNAVNYIADKGRIVYTTCTLRKRENEKQVEEFLKDHPDFNLYDMHTFMPHIDLTDGFFVALLVK